jgi:hypothetical protein
MGGHESPILRPRIFSLKICTVTAPQPIGRKNSILSVLLSIWVNTIDRVEFSLSGFEVNLNLSVIVPYSQADPILPDCSFIVMPQLPVISAPVIKILHFIIIFILSKSFVIVNNFLNF